MEGNHFPSSPSHSSAVDEIASGFTAVTKYLREDHTIQYSDGNASNTVLGQFAKICKKHQVSAFIMIWEKNPVV